MGDLKMRRVATLLVVACLAAVVLSVPLEDPMQEVDDMIDHMSMDEPEKGRLGEGRSTNDDGDQDEDNDLFAMPTEENALKYDNELEERDESMAKHFKEADPDETMDLLKTEGGLDENVKSADAGHSKKH